MCAHFSVIHAYWSYKNASPKEIKRYMANQFNIVKLNTILKKERLRTTKMMQSFTKDCV